MTPAQTLIRSTSNLRSVLCGLALACMIAGCASSGTPPSDGTTAPESETPAPSGLGYVAYYVADGGVGRWDASVPSDRLILPAGAVIDWAAAPGGGHVAVAYRRGDSLGLALIDVATGAVRTVHSAAGSGEYTFGWSPDGLRLGAAFRPAAGASASAVFIVGAEDGAHTDVGCRASDHFLGWRPNGDLIVGDASNVYAVRAGDCGTVATLPRRGKANITYSPDGRYVAFTRDRSVPSASGGTAVRRELYVANYDGSGPRKVADYQADARHLRWSPRGDRLGFTLRSPQYANVTHVAVLPVPSGQATYDARSTDLGSPADDEMRWSPAGTAFAHLRRYGRVGAGQSYETRQIVVRPAGGGDPRIVFEELVRDAEPVPPQWGWIDERHLVVAAADGWKLVPVDSSGPTTDLPGPVLHVIVGDPSP